MPTLDTFWAIASPTTLAGLIADIDQADHDRQDVAQLRQLCIRALVANVGDDEAKTLLNAAEVGR